MRSPRASDPLPTRHASLRVLALAMVGCVLLPVLLLLSGAVTISRETARDTDDRLQRTADIMHEQATKVLQSSEVLLQTVAELTDGLSDERLSADGTRWHDLLATIVRGMPQVQSLWIFGADGRPLVSSISGALPERVAGEDDLFVSPRQSDHGLTISRVVRPPAGQGAPFFSLTVRRRGPGGGFGGVVSAALLPSDFLKFYQQVGAGDGRFLGLYTSSGERLVRFPPLPAQFDETTAPATPEIAVGSPRGLTTSVSSIDGLERRVAWRRLDPYPVFVMTAVETAVIRRAWLARLSGHLIFGVPATLLMLGALWLAMARTRALFDEADRRGAAEQALQRAQRLESLGELTGGVAHDFNNLLMIVLGNADRMRRRPREAADLRALDTIVAAVRRGSALTRQLLSFARRRALFPEPIDVPVALGRMRGLIEHSLRENIALEIDDDVLPGACAVKVDPSELELAVLNVAVNARDAMPTGGRLTLRVGRVDLDAGSGPDGMGGAFVTLSLSDTGKGIPAEVLVRVFDPFFTTKDVGKGTGLGLSQVYGFARQSGGTATIDSELGKGTTVTLWLPRCDEPLATGRGPGAPGHRPGEGRRTLLIEPDAERAARILRWLERAGLDVSVAVSAKAVLALPDLRSYALLIGKFSPPEGIAGLELLMLLRKRNVKLPVILEDAPAGATELGLRHGFTPLANPCSEADLAAAVRAALRGVERSVAATPVH